MSSSRTEPTTPPASPGREAEEAGGTLIVMPQMGVSVAEGTIVEWRKRDGDWVEADETICDVSTDKVDVEIPAPCSGRLESIIVQAGETVNVGVAIARIDPQARAGEAHPQEAETSAAKPNEPKGGLTPFRFRGSSTGRPAADGEIDRSEYYSPVVRRVAAEHGIDLSKIEGTGVGGRIRKADVLARIQAGTERPLHSESPYRPEAAEQPEAPDQPGPGDARREPMSPMRAAIARHMLDSIQTSAHCTTIVEADMRAVADRRAGLREAMERRGVRLTYLAFVARATVQALAEFPVLNSAVEGNEIVHHDEVHLGIAVALEDGLIVPVIRSAQRLSLEGIAAAIQESAERARSKRLEPDDVQGGTFTITNPGQFGAVLATPIINQPQVAILDLEAVVKRPVVIDDAIAIRPMANLCLSWDHRALDGAIAARFLSSVKRRLEEWK